MPPREAKKSSVAGQRERQRQRAAEQEAATGIKGNKERRTTGIAATTSMMAKKEFADIADRAEHVADIAGFIMEVRQGTSRTLTMTVSLSNEYGHDALDAANASSMGFAMFRVYVVPRSAFMEEVSDGDPDA